MREFINTLMYDIKINSFKSKIIILIFRMATIHSMTKLLYPISLSFVILNRLVNECFFGVELPYHLKIGKGFKIWHGNSFIINRGCIIGENFTIRQFCTLGSNKRGVDIDFRVGDNVSMGAHSCIIGDDINIGDNVAIGVGVIVLNDIPPNSYVFAENKNIIKDKRNNS